MKLIGKMMVIVLIGTMASCGEKPKSLYDQVMDIHDEVMPKMNDIYKMRKSLQDSLANSSELNDQQKEKMQMNILLLDSAGNSMMVWMREFNPPEPTNKEAFNKYMELELVKVKKMREKVLKALEITEEKK